MKFLSWLCSGSRSNELRKAISFLDRRGYRVAKYFPSIGLRDDKELTDALDVVGYHGCLVFDREGNVVGRIADFNDPSRRKLRLVVCND